MVGPCLRRMLRTNRVVMCIAAALIALSFLPMTVRTNTNSPPLELTPPAVSFRVVNVSTSFVTSLVNTTASPFVGAALSESPSECSVLVVSAEDEESRDEGLARVVRERKAAVLYIHIFKSGGTSVCSVFSDAKWSTPPTQIQSDGGGNCNLPPGFITSAASDKHKPTESWLPTVNARWRFAGIEFEGLPRVPSSIPSPRCAMWVIQLRDPRNRMLSHFYVAQNHFECLLYRCPATQGEGFGQAKHLWSRHQDNWRHTNLSSVMSLDGGARFGKTTFAQFVSWLSKGGRKLLGPRHPLAPLASGDFTARHLCGFDACAPGACDDACLEVAKERLDHLFAIILITETLDAWGWRALQQLVGLKVPRVYPHRAGRADPSITPGCSANGCSTVGLMDPLSTIGGQLLDLLDLDMQLYGFAVDLAAKRHGQFGARPRDVSNTTKCEAQVMRDLRAKPRDIFSVSAFDASALRCGLSKAEGKELLLSLIKRHFISGVPKNRFSKSKKNVELYKVLVKTT